MGGSSIERHITLDKNMYGSDQSCSLDIQEFTKLVSDIRNLELSIISGRKCSHTRRTKDIQQIKKSRYFIVMYNFGNLKLVEIEIFNYCNRTCEFCPNETIDRKSKVIEFGLFCFLNTLKELKDNKFSGYVTFSRYNEPLSQDKLLRKENKLENTW